MTHLNDKYKRLIVDYEELRRLVMEIRSQMDDLYAPSLGDDQPASSYSYSAASILDLLYLNIQMFKFVINI
jgi:hypothetical protein